MKRHKKIILLGSAAFLVVVGASLGMFLGTGSAVSAGPVASIQTALQSQGLPIAGVTQNPVTNSLNVVIQSQAGGSPADAWANALVAREANFQAQSGVLSADTVNVTIVDGQGKTLYQWSGPVVPTPRPALKTVDLTALDSLRPTLTSEAQGAGAALQSLTISSDPNQGTVVDAEVTVSAAAGAARDTAIKWSTLGLLGTIRDYADGAGALNVDLYKIDIQDANGASLVAYVVDPTAKTVRAWMAPGVTPVWSTGGPAPAPTAVSATP